MTQLSKIIETALGGLNPRQKEVLTARFGLNKEMGDGDTLAAIGDRLKVTRERVRQIEASGIFLAQKNLAKNDEAALFAEKVRKYLAARGGVAAKADLVAYAGTIAKGARANQLDFLAEVSGAFNLHREDENYAPFYYLSDKERKSAKAFVEGWVNFLKDRKAKVFEESYQTQLASYLKTKSVAESTANAYLGVAKHIAKNPYGDAGLREWPEICPTTVRDKIYLVLKKKGEPLHFEDIAKHINATAFDDEKALAPTVHNELIKDDRFVLVGRGIYALREHGYEPGTAREVIAKVLKNKGPLAPADVITHVNQQRFFKPNTILINLQNRAYFERTSDGRYRVREA